MLYGQKGQPDPEEWLSAFVMRHHLDYLQLSIQHQTGFATHSQVQ